MTRVLLILALSLLFTLSVSTQDRYVVGALPAFNVNKKISSNSRINLKIESRQLFKEGRFGEESDSDYQYVLTDFALVGSTKMGFNSTLAGGYQLRVRGSRLVHRFIQQYSIVNKSALVRVGHRFASDQTFGSGDSFELRLRYRLTTILPLSGQDVDPQEFYVRVNNEYLNSFESGGHDLEVRLVPLLGYQVSDMNKVEIGVDYRIDSFLGGNMRNRFWTALNWYLAF